MSFHPNDVARRAYVASMLVSVAIGVLSIRFFGNQVLANDEWVQRSEAQHYRRLPIPAPRGRILDRNGKVIAESAVAYSVSFLASSEDSLKATMDRLNAIIQITPDERRKAIRSFRRDKGRPTVIFPDASFDKVSVLEEHRPDFPSLVIQATPKRFYPTGAAVGPFVGYTREVTDEQLRALVDSGYEPGQQIGTSGLEEQYERLLRGVEGASVVEVDAHMRVVGGENARLRQRAVPGRVLQTTIDLDLQEFIHKMFVDSALVGGVVALDPKTGGVLALYSSPSIDPNRWIGGIPTVFYRDTVQADPRKPELNKAIQGLYEPGSTFKLATAIIGLQEGLIKPSDHMPQSCGGGYQFGNRYWKCWQKEGHGSLDLVGAIQKSCDVYFYQLGQKLAINRLVAGGIDLGFVTRSGIDLPEDKAPFFPRFDANKSVKSYYDARFGPNGWTAASEVLNLSIGQGANAQTVVNMARFYAALANGGLSPTVRIAKGEGEPVLKPLFKLDSASMKALQDGLEGVLEAGGTAAASAIKGVTVAGKTGTAQTNKFINGVELNHAWFAGYAPASDPRIVVAVMWEHGGHGSRVAHLATAIMEHYLRLSLRPVAVTGN